MDCASSYSTSRLFVAGLTMRPAMRSQASSKSCASSMSSARYWPPGTRPLSTARSTARASAAKWASPFSPGGTPSW